MSNSQTAAVKAADTLPRTRRRRVGTRVRLAQQTVRPAPQQSDHPTVAGMRQLFREEIVGMPPELLAQLAERLRTVESATGLQNVFTVPEAAAYSRHGERSIWRLIASGDLLTTRLGASSRVLVTRAALDELLARGAR